MKVLRALLISVVFIGCFSGKAVAIEDASSGTAYTQWKQHLHEAYGLDYRVRAGFIAQRGAPNGKETLLRDKYEIEANWDMFASETWGAGSIQFLYEDINYPKLEGSQMSARIGVVEPINDDAFQREYFKRFTYTHQFTGKMKHISLSVGQFLIGNFGKASYKSKPLSYFNNFSLAKNMTKGYPTGGVGAYLTYTGFENLILIAGGQDTTNYYPQNISVEHLDEHKWTSFVYASWTPKLTSLGKTIFTGFIYHSPAIQKYDGQFNRAFTKEANGWSFTARQDIGKWTVLGKINGSTGNRMCVEQSYVAEVMYHNPFERNELDQIGIGFGANKISTFNANAVRPWENVAEAYITFGISDFITITPDIQLYINPALTREHHTAVVSSVQMKFLF